MKILFASCYPDETFYKLILEKNDISQPAQKFNKLLVKGCCINSCDVEVVVPYIATNKELIEAVKREVYQQKEIAYKFCDLSGGFLKRSAKKRSFVKKIVSEYVQQYPDGIVIIDSLSPIAYELSREAKKSNLKVVTHITDFLEYILPMNGNIYRRFKNAFFIKKFYKQFDNTDIFVLLTAAMKEKLNIGNRKFLIMDGVCDSELRDVNINECINREFEKVIFMYSGALCYKYGLKNLVEGFLKANCQNSELHLYGNGDYVSELKNICKENQIVRYFGMIPNEKMILEQKRATFLVNPRPIGDEYTKYSFPSKNIEYMVSGRPIITTKLPCITEEYQSYVIFFEDDTVDGICKTIKRCSDMQRENINKKGSDARDFILKEKNNEIQIKRVIDILRG